MPEPGAQEDLHAPTSPRPAFLRHVLVSAALWVTYVVYWRIVLGRGVGAEARLSVVILGLFVVLQLLLTLAWIAHNRSIARDREGRRYRRPVSSDVMTQDFLGRTLQPYPPSVDLTRAAVVTVRVDGDVKRFEAGIPLGEARAAMGE
jgi:hypothetical protein